MAIETKHRESNIELFRIIMMLLIVAHHYVVDSGLLGMIAEPPYTWKHYFLYVFGMWGKIGINCFVLITGYFMCKSEISVRKFLKLLFEICFYYIVIYLIFVLCGYEELSAYGIYYALNPCKQIANSFTSCFLIYYLLIPFLNVMVNHLTKREHALLIAICITFFVIWDRLPGVIYYYNYVGWFCVLHVIASYIRFYLPKYMEKAHNRHEVFRMAVWGGIRSLDSDWTMHYDRERLEYE